MKDPGFSRRTRASGRGAGAPSIAVAMVGVKRKLRRARTSEGQDSLSMQYKVGFTAGDIKASSSNSVRCIARRLHAICGSSKEIA